MASKNPTPDDAAAGLAAAEHARDHFARRLALPPLFFGWIGLAVSVQLAATVAGIAPDSSGSQRPALVGFGMLAFALIAGVQLAVFRRSNGVWIAGLVSRAVLGTAQPASLCYLAALAAGLWAGFAGHWGLVAVCSFAGGLGYALSGSRWWRTYRGDPSGHSRAESVVVLAVCSGLAVAGLIVLVLWR